MKRPGIIACVILLAGQTVAVAQVVRQVGPRLTASFTLEQAVQTRTIGPVAVSSDGRWAAFGLGGHYFGFPIVPRFGQDNNLRIVSLDTGEIRQLTSGLEPKARPVFSPAGDRVAFESADDIWVVRVADGAAARVTTNRARDTAPSWSPDGRRVAFLSNRGGGTDLWIASVDGERHGVTRITHDGTAKVDPHWSPDGRLLAYASKGPTDFYAQGIFVVTSGGGTPRRITPADEFEYAQPRWSPDSRQLAVVSDRSGHSHVWVMNADGTEPRHFDSGLHDSDAPHFAVVPIWSRDGARILTSRHVDGRFELLVISVPDGAVAVARSGPGQYHEVGWRHDGQAVYLHENAWSPPDLFVGPIKSQSSSQLTFSSHAMFREAHTAQTARVSFASTGNMRIPALLLTPRNAAPGARLPAIVALHPNGDGQFYDHWNPFFHFIAQSGYALLLVDQRGSSGHGRAFRTAQIGNWGTGTFDDVKAAAAFVRSLPGVDPRRVGVMGLSFGGYQTLLALTKTPDLFAAGVSLMGPSDRRGRPGDRYRELQIGATEAQDPALYDRISPITSVAALRAPLLLIHSDDDRNVPPEDTYRLIDELERHAKPYEAVIYPGEAHGLADPTHQLDSYQRIVAFFDKWLTR